MEGVDGRGVGIGEGADVVLAIGTEGGAVPARFVAKTFFLLALEVDRIELLVERRSLMGKIVDDTLFLVDRTDRHHIVAAFGNLVDQLAIQVVHIDVVVAVALGGEKHVLAVVEEHPSVGHFDVGIVLLGVEGADGTRAGICQKQLHLVL